MLNELIGGQAEIVKLSKPEAYPVSAFDNKLESLVNAVQKCEWKMRIGKYTDKYIITFEYVMPSSFSTAINFSLLLTDENLQEITEAVYEMYEKIVIFQRYATIRGAKRNGNK